MSGRIPQQFIDSLIARVDIIDVIDSRVPLKKAGREYKACCPFHGEKTPSFTVSPGKQFYHCFGCGAHGTAIGFLMDYEHMDFVEVVEELARGLGMEVPREGVSEAALQRSKEAPSLYEMMQKASGYYQQQLRQHTASQRAKGYLSGRGLSGEIAKEFAIGFAPPGWDNLKGIFPSEQQDLLLQAGLVIENETGRRYDRFRDRIVFPIRDRRGRVIAFGGRVLDDGTPKYLNSPETPLFHKGRELYGLYEVRQALREIPRILVVEGYMDVVALAQYGVRYGVATLGTAVTKEHLEQLFRVTTEIVFCFDGDRAGREAAWRGLEQVLPMAHDGRQIRFMFMPEGEDPDTLIRNIGKEEFERSLEMAMPLSDYLFEQLAERTDLSHIDGISRMVELAKPHLERLPEGIFRHLILDRLAQRIGQRPEQLNQMLGGHYRIATPSRQRVAPSEGGRNTPSPVRKAIALLLQNPEVAAGVEIPQRLAELPLPGVALLAQLLEFVQQSPNVSTAAILEQWRGREEERHLQRLACEEQLLDDDRDDLAAELRAALEQLVGRHDKLRMQELLQKSGLSEEEKTEFRLLMGKRSHL